MKVLGVRFGHDAAAALVVDGKIVADAAEERFSRIKNDTSFPIRAIEFCLQYAGIESEELDCLAIPGTAIPRQFFAFFQMPKAVADKSRGSRLKNMVKNIVPYDFHSEDIVLPLYQKKLQLSDHVKIHNCKHHLAHAASAAFTSGLFDHEALIVTMDGSGDNTSVAIWRFKHNHIELIRRYGGKGSLGWFYANATEAMGWRHGSDEWKLMGLAPYGRAKKGKLDGFYPKYRDGALVEGHAYGKYGRWNDHGANHYHHPDAYDLAEQVKALGREDFAATVQNIAEEQAMNIVLPWLKKENTRTLLCAGGFFLNVKFNQKLWETGALDTQWIYPNPGDAGLAAGAALHAYYANHKDQTSERLTNLYLGPEYTDDEIETLLKDRGIKYRKSTNIAKDAAEYLSKNYVLGWFQGRMESGPRALGHRSILMSPLKAENKDIINHKVKYREPFRPFCPSIVYEKAHGYLQNARDEFFMVTSFTAKEDKKNKIPAVIHQDGTARPQMVQRETNRDYYDLIRHFGELTGEYVVLNTSFNIKGEPIVCHPREAIKCFYDTGIDVLVLGDCIIEKANLSEK